MKLPDVVACVDCAHCRLFLTVFTSRQSPVAGTVGELLVEVDLVADRLENESKRADSKAAM